MTRMAGKQKPPCCGQAARGLGKKRDVNNPAITSGAAQVHGRKCLYCRHYDCADLLCYQWRALTLPENPAQDCYERKYRVPGKKGLTETANRRHSFKRDQNPLVKACHCLEHGFFHGVHAPEKHGVFTAIIGREWANIIPFGEYARRSQAVLDSRPFLRPMAAMKTQKTCEATMQKTSPTITADPISLPAFRVNGADIIPSDGMDAIYDAFFALHALEQFLGGGDTTLGDPLPVNDRYGIAYILRLIGADVQARALDRLLVLNASTVRKLLEDEQTAKGAPHE